MPSPVVLFVAQLSALGVTWCWFLSSLCSFQALSPAASILETQQWLHKNRFSNYARLFTSYTGEASLLLPWLGGFCIFPTPTPKFWHFPQCSQGVSRVGTKKEWVQQGKSWSGMESM